MARVTEYAMRVRATDMDSDLIVNNARFFEYFQEARLEHMRALGIIGHARSAGGPARSLTLAETTCAYRSPLRYPDEIIVRAWTKEVRNRSFVFAYEIVRRDTGASVAEGSSAQVWLDGEGRPAPLPGTIREALESSLD